MIPKYHSINMKHILDRFLSKLYSTQVSLCCITSFVFNFILIAHLRLREKEVHTHKVSLSSYREERKQPQQ